MDQYMKLKCGDYLQHVLQGVITEVQESNESCEVWQFTVCHCTLDDLIILLQLDPPTLMDSSDSLEKRIERLKHFINLTTDSIFNSATQCPL